MDSKPTFKQALAELGEILDAQENPILRRNALLTLGAIAGAISEDCGLITIKMEYNDEGLVCSMGTLNVDELETYDVINTISERLHKQTLWELERAKESGGVH